MSRQSRTRKASIWSRNRFRFRQVCLHAARCSGSASAIELSNWLLNVTINEPVLRRSLARVRLMAQRNETRMTVSKRTSLLQIVETYTRPLFGTFSLLLDQINVGLRPFNPPCGLRTREVGDEPWLAILKCQNSFLAHVVHPILIQNLTRAHVQPHTPATPGQPNYSGFKDALRLWVLIMKYRDSTHMIDRMTQIIHSP